MPLLSFPCPYQLVNEVKSYILSLRDTDQVMKRTVLATLRNYYKGLCNVYSQEPGFSTQYSYFTYTWVPCDASPEWRTKHVNKSFFQVVEPLRAFLPSLFTTDFIREIDSDFYRHYYLSKIKLPQLAHAPGYFPARRG